MTNLLQPLDVPYMAKQTTLPLYYHNQSQSTQIDAKLGCLQNNATPSLYLADQQLQAKGRFGRPFYTKNNQGIYMTLHLRRHQENGHPWTLLVAAAICKAIERLTDKKVQIKWVNDIYIKEKKIAGILTEIIPNVNQPEFIDIYIGVGINFAISHFPDKLTDKAGSLFEKTPAPIRREDLILAIWDIFQTTPEKELIKYYKDRSLVLDNWITFLDHGETKKAFVREITDKGELLIELSDKTLKTLNSGEISLISW